MRFHWEEVSLFCLGKMEENVVVMDCRDVVLSRNSVHVLCSPINLLPCSDDSSYKYGYVTCCLKSFTGALPMLIAPGMEPKLFSLAEKVLHSLALASFLLSPFPALCGPAVPNYLQLSQAPCRSLCLNLPL